MRIHETAIIHGLTRGAVALLLVAVLLYPADWLIWKMRDAAGHGMGNVTVDSVTTAALKGNREAYYTDVAIEVPCSRSLFPQAGAGACWWLRRHRELLQND